MSVPGIRGPHPPRTWPRPPGMCPRPRAIGPARRKNPDRGRVSAPASHLSTPRATSLHPCIPVRAHGYPSAPIGISSCLHWTNIKGGVPVEEGNHFQPQFHALDLSSELLAWNYLSGYGSSWMLRGYKSPL
jgi:hypothetical protein